jgi:DNA-binding MarR family transcriptional regulator
MSAETWSRQPSALPDLRCACANLRRAARVVSRIYGRELRSQHIEITQFTILMTLERTGQISQGKLGRVLALDSTTLTRTLALLRKRGWIREKEGDDRRFRMIELTSAGRTKVNQGLPHWKRAQDRLQGLLGESTMNQLGELLARISTGTASR